MEKHNGKSGSFIRRHRWRASLETSFSHRKSPVLPDPESTDDSTPDNINHDRILADLDAFTDQLSISSETELPENVLDTFSAIIKFKTRKQPALLIDEDLDAFLYESVPRLCKIKTALCDAASPHADKLLHRIMRFMEEQLRALLLTADSKASPQPKLKIISSKHFSFKTEPSCPLPELIKDQDYPGFSDQDINKMNKIVSTMISAGYKNECSNAYTIARGNALYEQLRRLDFEKLNADQEVHTHKLNWEWLEPDIARWIRIIKHFSQSLIPAEWKLGATVFSDHFSVFRGLFVNLIRSLVTPLLDYATMVATLKHSAERLFKFLDMYEALHCLRDAMKVGDDEEQCNQDLNLEISSVTEHIGEGVANIFGDLERSIRHDAAKTPVPGGAVHPLTRYVLNYLRYACDYGETLEQIFQQTTEEYGDTEKSPLAAQIASVMSFLDGNLAVKSTLYKDPSLRDIFLMNNGRYILQKVKGSNEIKKLMGEKWCRRRSSEVRHYHKSYHRETWARLLQCITIHGKVNKKVLKERFKNFNAMFEEIHKTQGPWVVSDEQLQSELRAAISAVVIPAYRSFVGRYKHQLEGGKNMDKYIKYEAEDIEALIETLFEGTSMSTRRRF